MFEKASMLSEICTKSGKGNVAMLQELATDLYTGTVKASHGCCQKRTPASNVYRLPKPAKLMPNRPVHRIASAALTVIQLTWY